MAPVERCRAHTDAQYLAKLDATTQPYVEKVQTTTKPYTDAAAVKARELMDKIDVGGAVTKVSIDLFADIPGPWQHCAWHHHAHCCAGRRRRDCRSRLYTQRRRAVWHCPWAWRAPRRL